MNSIGLAKFVNAESDHATVCRMVKLVNVRRQRREDVQDGLQPIQRIGLQQRGTVARLLTSCVSTSRTAKNGRTTASKLSIAGWRSTGPASVG